MYFVDRKRSPWQANKVTASRFVNKFRATAFRVIQSNLFASRKTARYQSVRVLVVFLRETARVVILHGGPDLAAGFFEVAWNRDRPNAPFTKIYGNMLQTFRTETTFLDIDNDVTGKPDKNGTTKRQLVPFQFETSSPSAGWILECGLSIKFCNMFGDKRSST